MSASVIIGVGIDVVDVARFVATLHRVPALRDRLFTPEERRDAGDVAGRAVRGQGGDRQGAGRPAGMSWQDATVRRIAGAQPVVEVVGTVAAAAAALGVDRFHLSISHDAGIASAVVVAERD